MEDHKTIHVRPQDHIKKTTRPYIEDHKTIHGKPQDHTLKTTRPYMAVTFALAAAIDSTLAAAVRMSLLAVAVVASALSAASFAGDDSEAAESG